MNDLEIYLDTIGSKGSTNRLIAISSMGLGLRSEAAMRVCDKRQRRKYLMEIGLSYENAVLIVNKENN